ncbi:MAG: ATP-binding protein [Rhodospirillaceae bacterium]|nr:ATP-binding protein [Rhodospirillales bacterium]
MSLCGGHPADAITVLVRNACETNAARLAARLTAMAPPLGLPRGPGERPTVILFDSDQDDDLPAMLAEPVAAIIDVSCHAPMDGLKRLPSALLVRVSTALALTCDVAGPVSAALCRRLPQARPVETALRAAMQEAIGNAVMHGNLGMDSGLRSRCDGLAAFAHMMDTRAKDPDLARRAVTIAAKWNAHALVVTVEDCGIGFDHHAHAGHAPAPLTAHSGRGLAQIRAACGRVNLLSKGRRISMRFKLASA